MDSFVTIIKPQKKKSEISLHDKEIELLKKYIQENKNVFLCGSAGYGKTFILNSVLNESNSVEIWDEPLRKKDIFLPMLTKSNMNVYIEDYETDMLVQKHLIETVSEGGKITQKQLIVTSRHVHFMENFVTIIISKTKPEEIAKLKPGHPNSSLSSHKCNGNIHNFYHFIDFPYDKDVFKTPKEIVIDLLCNSGDINITDSLFEHGHIWSIIQENYPDSIEENYDKIAYSLSQADLYDDELYKGDWDIMPYFSLCAIKIPRMYFIKPLNKDNIRPGKFWTKFGNQKMRYQKIKSIQGRANSKLNHHEFNILREYAKKGDVSRFKEYNLIPQDFDVMNHLGLHNKLKQREVTKIKKLIKEEISK
tara:strand:- start:853 stop:1941 length:1089 start_codon:yes stop_codon:yes gene_type:complete